MRLNITKILSALLVVSLAANLYLVFGRSDSQFEQDALCSQFKDQASERIYGSYTYQRKILGGGGPSEIFFSRKSDACVAVWKGVEQFTAPNGAERMGRRWVIFDPVTNKEIFSESVSSSPAEYVVSLALPTAEEEQKEARFEEELAKIRN